MLTDGNMQYRCEQTPVDGLYRVHAHDTATGARATYLVERNAKGGFSTFDKMGGNG